MFVRIRIPYLKKQVFWVTILLATITGLLLPALSSAVRMPSANRECAICHIMWLDDFKREDVKPLLPYEPLPVEKTGKQDVSSTNQMCFSCHDGFVLDSRFLWKKKSHNHPVGIEPSDDVTIPTMEGKNIFPLNNDGKMYCGTCHSAHGVDWKTRDSPIFLRIQNTKSNLCTACHLNRVTGPEKGNHPVGRRMKKIPQSMVKAGSQFTRKGEIICQSCHLAHGSRQEKMLAKPNNNSQLCSSCHDEQKEVRQSKHNMAIVEPSAKNSRKQTASVAGPCSACHIPHKAKGPKLWARNKVDDKNSITAYCKSCHNPKGPAHKKTVEKFSHPVDVPVSDAGIIAREDVWLSNISNAATSKEIEVLPLFDGQGKRVKSGGNVTCLTCHDPHRWSATHDKPSIKDLQKVEGDGKNSFLRITNHKDSALCKNCHRSNATVTLSSHNMGVTAPSSKNVTGMAVSQSGACSACHLPHNGKGEYMWARKLKHDGKGVMSLCVSCHQKKGIARDNVVGKYSHPVHVSMTEIGTDTNLPLFSKDGHRGGKQDLIDCATCHNPHQWDPEDVNMVMSKKQKTEGDAGNSFLRKKANGNAELCLDCHKKKRAVIGTDHDMSVTAADAHNSKGQTVQQSGLCGQCHSIHHASQSLRLWARDIVDDDKDAMKMLCVSCHKKGGIAKDKVPDKLTHPPRNVMVNKGRLRNEDKKMVNPPVFTKEGKHSGVGMITCPTCHDVHKWEADGVESGSGKNQEGDVRNSFLRHSNTEYFLCSDCHGEDSIYRYKYFHWEKSRPKSENKGLKDK